MNAVIIAAIISGLFLLCNTIIIQLFNRSKKKNSDEGEPALSNIVVVTGDDTKKVTTNMKKGKLVIQVMTFVAGFIFIGSFAVLLNNPNQVSDKTMGRPIPYPDGQPSGVPEITDPGESSRAPQSIVEIEITDPEENSEVPQSIIVRGSSGGIDENNLYIIVYDLNRHVFCIQGKVEISPNGNWESPVQFDLSNTSSFSKDFEIIAYLADCETSEEIELFKSKCLEENHPPEDIALIEGGEVIDTVIVKVK